MAFIYNIRPNASDAHQMATFWLAVVVPFAIRDSYNRNPNDPDSIPQAKDNPVAEAPVLIIDNDCVAWQCSSSKDSHVSGLELILKPNRLYTKLIAPEDWILFWAFNDYADYLSVRQRVQRKERCNQFQNAPKFVGRVATIFKDKKRDPGSGRVDLSFNITANGFSELDSKVYYNSSIGFNNRYVQQFYADFGNAVNEFITTGLVTGQKAIPKLLNIALGLGPGERFKNRVATNTFDEGEGSSAYPKSHLLDSGQTLKAPDVLAFTTTSINFQLPGASKAQVLLSPNDVYLIPDTIVSLLLSSDAQPAKGRFTYSDLLKTYIGIQVYGDNGFLPQGNETQDNLFTCPLPISGDFIPQPINFNNVTVWSLLENYLNRPINEMYTALRVDSSGHVMPSIVIRQIPFSTNPFVLGVPDTVTRMQALESATDLSDAVLLEQQKITDDPEQNPLSNSVQSATTYSSLPRWVIDDRLIISNRTGRSNALRSNYVQIVGTPYNPRSEFTQETNYVLHKPIFDVADIKRAGLNMNLATTASIFIPPTISGDSDSHRYWNKLMADATFGGHLKFSGTVVMKGIQEPICEGDNCVVDGVVYHIQRIQHSGSLDASGRKEFTTTLALTNGISVKSDNIFTRVIYPDLESDDEDDGNIGVNFEVHHG